VFRCIDGKKVVFCTTPSLQGRANIPPWYHTTQPQKASVGERLVKGRRMEEMSSSSISISSISLTGAYAQCPHGRCRADSR
jgi:hypothetical protein